MADAARRVVVSQRYFDDATRAYLEANNCDVVIADLPKGKSDANFTHSELVDLLDGAQGWIVGHAHITRELMAALPDLKIVSRRGVGYERVDIKAAVELGKVVTIAAGGNDAAVADHAIGLMLAVAKRFRESQNQMNAGNWTILTGSDLYQKTVGIIGFGRIGRSVAQRLRGFEAHILVHTPHGGETGPHPADVTFTDVRTILRESDFITLHAPLVPQTMNLVNAGTIATMKPTAILINTARGGLVEDRDLLDALKAGKLAGAGLDVFVSESDPAYKAVTAELIALPNVVATPHSAASSLEGLARTNRVAAQSVVAVLDGRSPARACVVADGRSGRQ